MNLALVHRNKILITQMVVRQNHRLLSDYYLGNQNTGYTYENYESSSYV